MVREGLSRGDRYSQVSESVRIASTASWRGVDVGIGVVVVVLPIQHSWSFMVPCSALRGFD